MKTLWRALCCVLFLGDVFCSSVFAVGNGTSKDGVYSWDFSDCSIRDILYVVSLDTGISIVSDDTVSGKADFRFTGKDFKTGSFVDKTGTVIGEHKGIVNYTIGQRKGLNLAMGHPVFVTGIDAARNAVVIGENEDLFTTSFAVKDVNFMAGEESMLPRTLMCKIRYAHKGEECVLSKGADGVFRAEFKNPVRAITPGQTAVFYDGEYVFAGSVIV